MKEIFCEHCHMKTVHERMVKKKRSDIIQLVCSDCGNISKKVKATKKEKGQKQVSINDVMDTKRMDFDVQDGEKTQIYGEIAELLARNFLTRNRSLLIKQIIGGMVGNSTLQMFQTQPTTDKVIGSITHIKSKRLIHGWNGDFGFILNNELLGKSAIIFEVKSGQGKLTESQEKFFEEVYAEDDKSCFMKGLSNLKIIIIRIYDLDLRKGHYKLSMVDYANYRKGLEVNRG